MKQTYLQLVYSAASRYKASEPIAQQGYAHRNYTYNLLPKILDG